MAKGGNNDYVTDIRWVCMGLDVLDDKEWLCL